MSSGRTGAIRLAAVMLRTSSIDKMLDEVRKELGLDALMLWWPETDEEAQQDSKTLYGIRYASFEFGTPSSSPCGIGITPGSPSIDEIPEAFRSEVTSLNTYYVMDAPDIGEYLAGYRFSGELSRATIDGLEELGGIIGLALNAAIIRAKGALLNRTTAALEKVVSDPFLAHDEWFTSLSHDIRAAVSCAHVDMVVASPSGSGDILHLGDAGPLGELATLRRETRRMLRESNNEPVYLRHLGRSDLGRGGKSNVGALLLPIVEHNVRGVLRILGKREPPFAFHMDDAALVRPVAKALGNGLARDVQGHLFSDLVRAWDGVVSTLSGIDRAMKKARVPGLATVARTLERLGNPLASLAEISVWEIGAAKTSLAVANLLHYTGRVPGSFSGSLVLPVEVVAAVQQGSLQDLSDQFRVFHNDSSRWLAFVCALPGEQTTSGMITLEVADKREELVSALSIMLRLIGDQLSYHLMLSDALRDARAARRHSMDAQQRLAESVAILHHQIASDTTAIRRELLEMVEKGNALISARDSKHTHHLQAHSRRLQSRVNSLPYYADMARGGSEDSRQRARVVVGDIGGVRNVVQEMCVAYSTLGAEEDAPGIRVSFEIDYESFDRPDLLGVMWDAPLFEEALSCVLDNAIKYARRSSIVNVALEGEGNQSASSGLMSVVSRNEAGLRLDESAAASCTLRGWRAGWSKDNVVGQGLGLWLAKDLMVRQGGDLIVRPTTSDGVTYIALALRTKHVGGR